MPLGPVVIWVDGLPRGPGVMSKVTLPCGTTPPADFCLAVLVTWMAPVWSVLVNVQCTVVPAASVMALGSLPLSHVCPVSFQLAGTVSPTLYEPGTMRPESFDPPFFSEKFGP